MQTSSVENTKIEHALKSLFGGRYKRSKFNEGAIAGYNDTFAEFRNGSWGEINSSEVSLKEGITVFYNGYSYTLKGGFWDVKVIDKSKESYPEVVTPLFGHIVKELDCTYLDCENLLYAPKLPRGIVSLHNTFHNCRSLKEPAEIPSSVKEMVGTYSYCESLQSMPVIPVGVTNIKDAFRNCVSLVNVRDIPASVTKMDDAFCGCISLKVIPKILCDFSVAISAFYGCKGILSSIPNKLSKEYIYASLLVLGYWCTENKIWSVSSEETSLIMDCLTNGGMYLTVEKSRNYFLYKMDSSNCRNVSKSFIKELLSGSTRDTSSFPHFSSEIADVKLMRKIPTRFSVDLYASDKTLQRCVDDLLLCAYDFYADEGWHIGLGIEKGSFVVLKVRT